MGGAGRGSGGMRRACLKTQRCAAGGGRIYVVAPKPPRGLRKGDREGTNGRRGKQEADGATEEAAVVTIVGM